MDNIEFGQYLLAPTPYCAGLCVPVYRVVVGHIQPNTGIDAGRFITICDILNLISTKTFRLYFICPSDEQMNVTHLQQVQFDNTGHKML